MSDDTKRDDMKFDVRALNHRLRRGEVSGEEIARYLDALPDEAAEVAETKTEFVASFEERNYNS
jgi:hypothetical protein